MDQVLQVMYSCDCGLKDRKVSVPVRKIKEPVDTWMKNLTKLVSRDHETFAPNCKYDTLSTLKIPMSNREYLGGPEVDVAGRPPLLN